MAGITQPDECPAKIAAGAACSWSQRGARFQNCHHGPQAKVTPARLRRLHFWLTIAWLFPGVLAAWWIVYRMPEPHATFAILVVSLWANTASHWAAYQAVRAEQSHS